MCPLLRVSVRGQNNNNNSQSVVSSSRSPPRQLAVAVRKRGAEPAPLEREREAKFRPSPFPPSGRFDSSGRVCVCELREEEEEPRSHTLWSVKSERDPPSRRGIDFGKKRRKNEVKKFEPEANRRAGSERVAKCASSNPLCRRGGESSRNLVAVVLFSTSVCCCVNLSFDSLRASRRRLFVV